MLVFNEQKHCQRLLEKGFETYPNKRDLVLLCKYWLQNGVAQEGLEDTMISFCKKWNPKFNYAKSEGFILEILKNIEENKENSFSFCKNIVFFDKEIEKIRELPSKKLQKVGFVLMSLAKWRNVNFIYINEGGSIKLKDVFTFAGIKDTKKEMLLMLHSLNDCGFIDIQLKPLLKIMIPSIVTEGNKVKEFIIDEDMIQYWVDVLGTPCQRCGCLFEKKCNKQKYCKDCAKKVSNEQHASMMREKRKVTKQSL